MKKYRVSMLSVLTAVLMFIVAKYGLQFGGAIIGTLLMNLVLILGIGTIYVLDVRKNGDNFVTPIDIKYNRYDIVISYVLIILLWLFGQFVFLWVYNTFGDSTYTKVYAESFGDKSVIFWTVILTCIVAPIAEELLFRYVLFGRLIYSKNRTPSYVKYLFLHILSCLSFALFHGTLVHLIVVVPLSLVLSMLMYKTNRIIYPILGHMLFNNMSIWLSSLLVIYKMYIDNQFVVATVLISYAIIVLGTIGFVLVRKKS